MLIDFFKEYRYQTLKKIDYFIFIT